VGDVVQEMPYHVPEGFMGHHIFLPAMLAIFSLYNGAAVQTVFIFPLRNMRHVKFSLKIGTKTYRPAFLFR
jgi:hypothetical protein